MGLQFLDFFAGIGGFRRGMELAGHTCVGFCEFDKFAVASYTSMHLITTEQKNHLKQFEIRERQQEILKEGYRNGEWYAADIRSVVAGSLPRADCWCFGFPCQDISVAGNQLGFAGHRSSLFFAVTNLIKSLEPADRPKLLFVENVKNLFSVNGGFDFARLLIELDEIGYDAEWAVLNSKDFGIPQNRERVFVVGHLRGAGTREVFPLQGTAGEGDSELLEQVPVLTANKGEGAKVAIPVLSPEKGETRQNGRRCKENGEPMFTLTVQDRHGVIIIDDTQGFDGTRLYENETSTLRSQSARLKVAVNVETGQTGADGNPVIWGGLQAHQQPRLDGISPALTSAMGMGGGQTPVLLQGVRIRKLTPKECFRLQAWEDSYFDRAAFVNYDSQLYKQAGNGVTVRVIQAIAERLH